MKKFTGYLSTLFLAAGLMLFVSCNNGAQTHDDTDRTESENGSSHPAGDTVMTDTTRNITSGSDSL